jgi:hypothetical protein
MGEDYLALHLCYIRAGSPQGARKVYLTSHRGSLSGHFGVLHVKRWQWYGIPADLLPSTQVEERGVG